MTLSRRLFRLWLILAGLWVAYIVSKAIVALVIPPNMEGLPAMHPYTVTIWAAEWALLPPAAFLLSGWRILRVAQCIFGSIIKIKIGLITALSRFESWRAHHLHYDRGVPSSVSYPGSS